MKLSEHLNSILLKMCEDSTLTRLSVRSLLDVCSTHVRNSTCDPSFSYVRKLVRLVLGSLSQVRYTPFYAGPVCGSRFLFTLSFILLFFFSSFFSAVSLLCDLYSFRSSEFRGYAAIFSCCCNYLVFNKCKKKRAVYVESLCDGAVAIETIKQARW